MNDSPTAQITIRALRFFQKFREDPNGEMHAEDWIEYCAPGQAAFTTIEDAVRRLQRDKTGKWLSVDAAYKAWKSGEEVPENGTPLGAWPGISDEQRVVLKASGVRTVEEVAAMTETIITRIRLPNPRALRDQACRFLEARSGAAVEAALKARDDEIATLKAQMETLLEMAENGPVVEAKNKGGRPRKDQQAAA